MRLVRLYTTPFRVFRLAVDSNYWYVFWTTKEKTIEHKRFMVESDALEHIRQFNPFAGKGYRGFRFGAPR